MSLIHFLPGVVKELLKHVPSLAVEITDWDGVRRDLPLISSRLFTGAGTKALIESQSGHLAPWIHFSSRTLPKETRTPTLLQEKGDALLRYYFAQLYHPEGMFLDLRDRRLQWSEGKLHFHPTGFWYVFSPSFRKGLLELYRGFYLGDDSRFEAGLEATGLLSRSWPIEDQREIKNLFRSHFGESLERPMRFDLKQFQQTFVRIFEFLVRKKVKLSSEFMLFGIYLVTLYLSLESYGTEHSTKTLFLEVHHALGSGPEWT
jgi:hypothetical protein